MRLSSVLGEPFGRDKIMMTQMAIEWADVLFGLRPEWIDAAVTDWIRTESRWPRPAELRTMAFEHAPREKPKPREPHQRKDPAAVAGMKRIEEIRKRHEHSETPFSDTFNDPDYQQYLKDYTARTGLAPG